MPEAAVDEDHLRVPREHNVRCSRKIFPMQPKAKSKAVDDPPNDNFRLGVFLRNSSHDATADSTRDNVCHQINPDRINCKTVSNVS